MEELKQFERTFLECHNRFRLRHKVQHLVWSEKLAARARKWAIRLIAQSGRGKVGALIGANLVMEDCEFGQTCCTLPTVTKPTLQEAAESICNQWYLTEASFVVGETAVSRAAAPFTQMVWKGTQRVGACLVKHSTVAVLVSFYWPPGNVENEFSHNVTKIMKTPILSRRRIEVDSPTTPVGSLGTPTPT